MKLVDPVARIRDHEFAHRVRNRSPSKLIALPQSVVFLAEKLRREFGDVVSVGTQMVVDHIQDHAQPQRVRPIDKAPEIVGAAIDMRRREPLHAVVTPTESAGKFGHRHHFQDRDAGFSQLRQLQPPRCDQVPCRVNVPMCIS